MTSTLEQKSMAVLHEVLMHFSIWYYQATIANVSLILGKSSANEISM